MKVTVYYKPTCTTSRKAIKFLEEKGVEVEKVNYFEKPFSKNKLKTFIKKMGMKAQDLLRKRAKEYKELDFKNKKYTQEQIIEFMIKYPDLIERPIIVKEDVVILGRPVEKIEEIL